MKTIPRYFQIRWPNWRSLFRNWVLLCCCLGLAALVTVQPASAQTGEAVSLTVKLRHSDGTAVVGETIVLERLPEEAPIPPSCTTDTGGSCSWAVERGLYQLLFERPLDDISALAVAEGGLRGLGITVGDESITYHFTFHSDGRVYFDAVPEAAVPSPIVPVGDVLHGGTAPTPTLTVTRNEPVEETPTPGQTSIPDTAVRPAPGSPWRLILFIAGGLVIGGSLHLRSRKKQTFNQTTRRLKDQTTTQPNDEETKNA